MLSPGIGFYIGATLGFLLEALCRIHVLWHTLGTLCTVVLDRLIGSKVDPMVHYYGQLVWNPSKPIAMDHLRNRGPRFRAL